MDETRSLDGITVVDLGCGHAGALAAMLLAEAGARVVRIEDVGRPSSLRPAQAAIWNRSKQPLPLDLKDSAGQRELAALLDETDILILDRTPAEAQQTGLDEATLKRGHPALTVVRIGGWPAGHPLQDRPVDDFLVLAESGLLDEQIALDRDGPVYLRFPLGSCHAAYLAAIGAVLRLRIGAGKVGTSLLQGALLPQMMYWGRADKITPALEMIMTKENPPSQVRCGDDRWIHIMPDPHRAPEIREALVAMDQDARAKANKRFDGVPVTWFADRGALEEVFLTRPRDEWLRLLWAADVPAEAVAEMGALYRDEQVLANGYAVEVNTEKFGPTRQPAIPIQIQPPLQIGPNPRPSRRARPVPATPVEWPLAGLKVVDFGNYLAGPLAPMLMADLGADVIKVESLAGDPLRASEWPFNACQRGKRSLALDLKNPASGPIIERLTRWADVVHHNQRMPAAEKTGIGPEKLLALNPALIYCHVSAYGPLGPRKDWPGYDQLFQAASGWEIEAAGAGNRPTWMRFGLMDHLAALASLHAVVLALRQRDLTGCGQAVSASLLGASLLTMESPLAADGTLVDFPHLDAGQWGLSPLNRIYACRDGWIAVHAKPADTEAMARLLSEAGIADPADLESVFAARHMAGTLAMLGRADVPAVEARCAQQDAFLDAPDNRRLGLSTRLPHEIYGHLTMPGASWDFDDIGMHLHKAPPLLGEHTTEVLSELGFDAAQIGQWRDAGVVLG